MGNFITLDEAAVLLGVTRRTVNVWIADGRLVPAFPGGKEGHPKIDKRSLETFYRPKEEPKAVK